MNRQKKSSLSLTYRHFLHTCLGIDDFKNLKGIVDDKIMGFGTTIDEKIMDFAETKKLINQQKKQSKGMDFQWKIKPLSHYISADENTAVFADELFLKIDAGGETIKMYIRFSIVLSYFNNQWKVLHWHGSKPENVQSEEDTFGIKNWRQKAEALEKLVKERTIDLVEKNRELEIEAALEKVRSIAMSMNKPDDMLDVCKTISLQLQSLGVKEIRNVQTAIINESKGTYMNYQYYAKHDKTFITDTVYTDHKVAKRFVTKMLKGKGQLSISHIKGRQKLKEWIAYQRGTNVFIDKYLNTASTLHYYWYSLGTVALGISTYQLMKKEEWDLFLRFLKVFDLAYRRYLDIEKAEAQAKEAQVQLALERVRSRSLAMHHTSELQGVVNILAQQLHTMGMDINGGVFITINDEVDENLPLWASAGAADYIQKAVVPFFDKPIFTHLRDAIIKRNNFFEEAYSKKRKDEMFKHLFRYAPWNTQPEKRKKELLSRKGGLTRLAAISQHTSIAATNHNGKIFSDEEKEILKRFGNVFEQSYIRFLDLQKAEAQAREAKIETALEKVRSRSLAMHSSNELNEVVTVLFERLKDLQVPVTAVGIHLFTKGSKDLNVYVCGDIGSGLTINNYLLPYFNHPIANDLYDAHDKRFDFFVGNYSKKEKNSFYKYVFEHSALKDLPGEIKNMILKSPTYSIAMAASKNSVITVNDFVGKPLSDAEADVVKRFAKIFEQAYIRFLDLQKAEAQAREAQIEAALERVRSRTMAMHKTEELLDVAEVVHKELSALGFNSMNVSYAVVDDDEKYGSYYSINPVDGKIVPIPFIFPHTETEVMRSILSSWKKQESFNVIELNEKATLKHQTYIGEHIQQQLAKNNIPFLIEEFLTVSPKKAVLSTFNFSKGYLFNIGGERLSKSQEELMLRFTRVFEQTYTRFLDLQKAEAQARQAQIELALERARTQSMMMQHSKQLDETLRVFHEQVLLLGIPSAFSFLWLPNEETDRHIFWAAWAESNSTNFKSKAIDYPLDRNEPATAQCFVDWKSKEPVHSYHVPPAGVKNYFAAWKELLGGVEKLKPKNFPGGLYYVEAFMKYGCFGVMIENDLSEDEKKVLPRFSIEFERTYTRFLDLQKAEKQAMEARIEASLERIRAKAMSMHRSEELDEVLVVLWEQFYVLDIRPMSTHMTLIDIESNTFTFRETGKGGHRSFGEQVVAIDSMDIWKHEAEKWRTSEPLSINRLHFPKESLPMLWQVFHESFASMPDDAKIVPEDYPDGIYHTAGNCQFGYIGMNQTRKATVEEEEIVLKFATEFGRFYQRFLDLKKAEAQTKEAQIEAGLERVRSRAMAMQSSEEVNSLIGTVFTELTKLDLLLTRCIIWVFEPTTLAARWWMANIEEPSNPMNFYIKYHEHPAYLTFVKEWEKQSVKFVYDLKGQDKINWDDILFNETELKNLPDVVKNGMREPERVLLSASFNNFGGLNVASLEPLSEENFNILLRFAKVFDLTYTRFLDLQKAENQAKEARIEASLERVRSRTMAMHSSDDVGAATATMFTELEKLGVQNLRGGIAIINPDQTQEVWSITHLPDGTVLRAIGVFDMRLHPFWQQIFEAHKRKEDFDYYWLAGKDKEDYIAIINATPGYLAQPIKEFPDVHIQSYYFGEGAIWTNSMQPHSEEQRMVMKKFASVFSLTFRRYQDLQKAEAQSRESQIQLALERVRASTAAMHKSEELIEVIGTVFQQLQQLHFTIDAASLSLDYKTDPFTYWMAVSGHPYPSRIHVPYKPIPFMDRLIAHAGKGQSFFTELFNREEKNEWVDHILEHTIVKQVPDERKKMMYGAPGLAVSVAVSNNIALTIANYAMKPFKEDENEIVRRFSKVFEQTYTRFLDLQKAEAQAREGQVQLALERVRARTMAMQKSEELSDTSFVLFQQLKELGEVNVQTTIAIFDEDQPVITLYATTHGNQWRQGARIELNKHSIYQQMYSVWKQNLKSLVIDISGKELESLNKFKLGHPDYQVSAEDLPKDRWLIYCAYFSKGSLSIATTIPRPDESIKLLERFAQVFDLTYTRFLDLKKAEEQAREAQIEVALERVRGKAMAMHSPNDLADTIGIFYQQIKLLSVTPRRCGVCLMYKETNTCDLYNMNTTEQGDSFEAVGKLKLAGHPVLKGIYDHWLSQQDYHPVLRGDELKEYYKNVRTQMTSYPEYLSDEVQYGYFFSFPEGSIYAWTKDELPETDLQIYRRFTSVLSLTYKRFKDLQTAEANAIEAVKQAALDRIRADIASMRTVSDLDRITPLIWNELTVLGIPFIRCGVFIMDESQQLIHTFLSNPEGKAIAAFHLPYDTPGNLSKVLSHWKEHKNYIDHWDQSSFSELADVLLKQGSIATKGQYLDAIPQGGFYLHFLPFIQGMLYVGNITQFGEDEISLLQSVADAFATAYARYEDFNKLEEAKKQVDSTLTELQSAQKQLVQSEKMASLGELTAGIAHEIQNPLNFVNNFSEVSNELLQEMLEEVEKGNYEEVKTIVDDVKQNLEKINQHGKRADGIVKGMLQHSRASTGQKELTDINVLCDEYLRLSFHGLRAKDKSFNAKFETDFDASLPKINLVPQDIGRVILNLINNAFYAASLNLRQPAEGTLKLDSQKTPTVWVKTKSEGDNIFITVRDNGPGIPKEILDKIFQPFFTTKPTGQGTGLGLSLAYDIVKAHGGELKVETLSAEAATQAGKEGEGTTFIIQLTANQN